ncbi:MAG TPA: glycosyltransferase family 39 protein, partial [Terriglobales bacterium]|nr:glycosyltransferase family 39 protein [Terriglobales bacterium]
MGGATVEPVTSAREALTVPLLLLALVLAACGYRHHFDLEQPWWRWATEMALAGAIVIATLPAPFAAGAEGAGRRWLRWALFGIFGVAAAAGIHLALQPGAEVPAGLCLAGAGVVFLLSRWVPLDAAQVAALTSTARPPEHASPELIAGSLAAVATALLATVWNQTSHLAGLACWSIALAMLAAVAWRQDRRDLPTPRSLQDSSNGAAVLLVSLLAGLLRFPLLYDVPDLIDADEGRLGESAEQMFAGEGFPDLFGFGWNSFPNLAYAVHYAFVPLLGRSFVALRLSTASIGTLSVLVTYLWVRRWWGCRVAAIAATLLAINPEHLLWSRSGFLNIHAAAVAALVLATCARALASGRRLDFVWLGLAAGLSFYTYHAAKLFPALLMPLGLVLAVARTGTLRRHRLSFALGALTALIVVMPQIGAAAHDWSRYSQDVSNRFDLDRLIAAHQTGDASAVRTHLYTHVIDSLNSFISVPEKSPMLEPLVCVPFLIGVLWMLWHWRDLRHVVVLGWMLGLLVIGSMLTADPPSAARLVGLLPVACTIPAVLAGVIWCRLQAQWPRRGAALGYVSVATWLAAATAYAMHSHFLHRPRHDGYDVESYMCRTILQQSPPATVLTVGAGSGANPRNALLRCFSDAPRGVDVVNLPLDADVVPLSPTIDGNVAIFVLRGQGEIADLVRDSYPRAREVTVRDVYEDILVRAFFLSAAEVAASRGLELTYRTKGADSWQIAPADAALADNGLQMLPPGEIAERAVWTGGIHIAESGVTLFRTEGGTMTVGWGDLNRSAGPYGEFVEGYFAAGWHPIRIEATPGSKSVPPRVTWLPATSTAWQPLGPLQLLRQLRSAAIAGSYGGAAEGSFEHRLHAAIDFDYARWDDDEPPPWFVADRGTAEWRAVVALEPGLQAIRLDTTVPTT